MMRRETSARASRDRYGVEAVQRFARISALFSAARSALDLREIAQLAGIPVRTAAKIVATLEHRDFLSRTDSGDWTLGPAWLRLADCKRGHVDVREAGTPVMRWVREQLNETIILGVAVGDRRVIVECMVSTQPIRRVSRVGDEHPLHVGSSGRTILAGLSDADIASYLKQTKLVNCGYDTVTDPARIWSDVRKVRRNGYLTARAEITKESFSSSAPIRSYAGETVAALTITLPLSRLTKELHDTAVRVALEGARRISQRLGYVAERSSAADR